MTLRVRLWRLGTVKVRKGLRWKRQDRSNRSEPRWSCLGPSETPGRVKPRLFRKKVKEAGEVSQLGCMDSGDKLPRLKKGPWKKKAKICILGRKDAGGHWHVPVGERERETERDTERQRQRAREHTMSFALRVCIHFLTTRILGEFLGEDLISFPGVTFNMFTHWVYGERVEVSADSCTRGGGRWSWGSCGIAWTLQLFWAWNWNTIEA